jgi:hypothetical protein
MARYIEWYPESGGPMPDLKAHCADCQRRFGQDFAHIHNWLDEYARIYTVNGMTSMRHWLHRHTTEGLEEVRKLWGDDGVKAATAHILLDFKQIAVDKVVPEKELTLILDRR